MTRSNCIRSLAAAWIAVAMLGGCRNPPPPPPPPASPAPSEKPVRVVDRQLINGEAHYTLKVPDGWTLFEDGRPGLVVLRRGEAETAPTLAILSRPATSDAASEVARLRDSLLGSPMGYEVLHEGQRQIAGRSASELLTRFAFEGQGRVTRNVVLIDDDTCYVFGVEMPETQRGEVEPEIEALLASLEFGAGTVSR